MKTIVVIQARLSSNRLPAKVLLPIKGIPLVVLAANRAANTGRNILVVTSDEPSDDQLCEELKHYGIEYYRGSLNNTLDRFVTALKNYEDNTVVIRLTADNIVPDGHLLDELESFFLTKKLDYLICNGEKSGLPYGVSAEVMRLRSLKEALKNTVDLFDLEHVTPFVRRKFGETYFNKYASLNMGNYRCTVDGFDDYLDAQRLFLNVDLPETISWLELVEKLKNQAKEVVLEKPAKKLVLGGAQIGLSYGINNAFGKPDFKVSEALVKKAICNGVEYIDTAHAYGDSEYILGKILNKGWESRAEITTKLSPLKHCYEKMDVLSLRAFVKASVYESCVNLGVKTLSCLMLHRASHMTQWNGAVWQVLLELQKQGVIKDLGVSVQCPEEVEVALMNEQIKLIQMPFNILDHRWEKTIRMINDIKKERSLIIHVRSSLLQGLLISDNYDLWKKANIENPNIVIDYLNSMTKQTKCNSVLELCLTYVRSLEWIDGIVVGMETVSQLEENLRIFSRHVFSFKEIELINERKPALSELSLNPSTWNY